MKAVIYISLVVTMLSCQKEYIVQEEAPDNSIALNQELTDWILSVSAHDGSFDDILDQSRCFSLLFPYDINYDGAIRTIRSVNDLLGLEQSLVGGIQLPVTVTYANYVQETFSSNTQLNNAINACDNSEASSNTIRCIDFIYPVSMAVFNTETNVFDTTVVDHDEQTFLSVSNLTSSQRASLNFPINMLLSNGNTLEITSITDLDQILATHSEDCN